YREQWNDLLAGKAIGTLADLRAGNVPNPAKLKRFRELLFQRLMAGDPEVRGLLRYGRLDISPDDIDRLIEKWEKSPLTGNTNTAAAGGSYASKPLDFLKF